MNTHFPSQFFRIMLLIMFHFIFFSGISAHYKPNPEMGSGKVYRILEGSILTISGKTNMNHFSCSCSEPMPAQVFYIDELDDEHCTTIFRETNHVLKINSLDCGNKMMNKDMYKALNSSLYPDIKIELLEVSNEKCDLSGNSTSKTKFIALTRITLNGKSRNYWMKVTVQEITTNKFHFITEKDITMSDFDITPPTAAFGLVKVRDEIKISLDMVVIFE
ncbi:MAG TPA: YceI family protein [Saprospiraceae bacterium]|nr:YceI family protein [Saprospiraceae bacterium]